jgi:hypothetical protein
MTVPPERLTRGQQSVSESDRRIRYGDLGLLLNLIWKHFVMDSTDRDLLALLQHDATQSYAALGEAVGLSVGAAHERVRKLRERGVIRRTTVAVDPSALGLGVLPSCWCRRVPGLGMTAPARDWRRCPRSRRRT